MICTSYNNYIKDLVKKKEMLWCVTLNDYTKVYSDYYNPIYSIDEYPWYRLCKYCEQNNLFPCKVEAIMLGAPRVIMAESKIGLDGIFIKRGASKDFLMDSETGEGESYKQLIVGVLDKEEDIINVVKFCWPENEKEKLIEKRSITSENVKLMFFKNDSKQKKRESIQFALNGD